MSADRPRLDDLLAKCPRCGATDVVTERNTGVCLKCRNRFRPPRAKRPRPAGLFPLFSWPKGAALVGELGGLRAGGRYRAADDGRWATVRYILKGDDGRCVALVDFDDGQGGFWEFSGVRRSR